MQGERSLSFHHIQHTYLFGRVRATPGFGDAIRSCDANISDMKQMTAYKWEDLLQVCYTRFQLFVVHAVNSLTRLHSRSSKAYYQPRTTESCKSSSTLCNHSMHSQKCDCIQTPLCRHLMRRLLSSVIICEGSSQ